MENHRQVTELYHECAADHLDLIEAATTEERPRRWWEIWKDYF